jgi:hypothetical protein
MTAAVEVRPRSWRPHVVLLGLIVLEIAAWGVLHQSDQALHESWESGTSQERLDAIHVLLNRGESSKADFGQPFAKQLLEDEDERVQELAFLNDVCKYKRPVAQNQASRGFTNDDFRTHWRRYIFHRRKVGGYVVGGSTRLKRDELAWYLDTLDETNPLPRQEIVDYINRLAEDTQTLRKTLDLEGRASILSDEE